MEKKVWARGYVLLLMALMAFSGAVRAASETNLIRVTADPWCPYNCNADDARQGFMIEIARAALALSGYALEYQTVNWARAKKMVLSGEVEAIVGMSRTPENISAYVFPKFPLGKSRICFFKLNDNDWQYQSPESLNDKTVGWINDFGVGADGTLNEWRKKNWETKNISILSGDNVHERLMKMLSAGRIDTFVEDQSVISYSLKKIGFDQSISNAGCIKHIDWVYLAFSKEFAEADEWAKAVENGVNVLAANGKLDAILASYGLTRDSWLTENWQEVKFE